MGFLSAFVEKTYFYPLNHRRAGDTDDLYFQTRGDGLYPLIKDGDVLQIQQTPVSELQVGDLTLFERLSGEFAVHFVVRKTRDAERTSVKTNGDSVNGDQGLVKPERLVGRVAAIDREGRTKPCDDRLARLSHIIYFSAQPLMRLLLIVRKILSLFHPRFFVRDPGSSLRCVAEKYNDAEEVLYYSQRAFEGLDEEERLLVEQFMRRRGRVLIIGCGAGREAFALAELGFQVVGIDVASGMIAEAKRHAQTSGRNIHFEVKSATTLDYPSNSFEYVLLSAGVYSYIPTRQLRINTLRKINDLLTPNGILFLSTLYKTRSPLLRVSLYDAFRGIAKSIMKKRLHSEPGDILVRYVSPIGTPSKLCYVHIFKEASEVLEEITLADLDGVEDKQSGYWIVRSLKQAKSQGTVLSEVAG